jgi:hypothetical protein
MTGDYERLLAEIADGVRLHYEAAGDDPDLALLEGDQLYASGLARLAALGDLEATGVLANAISSVAQAHAEGDRQRAAVTWREHVEAVHRAAPASDPAREV